MKTYGLVGYPLKNSFSADYFNRKFQASGTEAIYKNFPLDSIGAFPSLLQNEQQLAGLNVTIPYKEAVIPFLDQLDHTATQVGAVNTIELSNNKLTGYNTDVTGFEKSILPQLKPWHQAALVLGTGGASKAVLFVLEKLGIKCTLVSRNAELGMLYEDVSKALIRSHQVIINCTPLGMHPDAGAFPPIPYQFITDLHLVFDLIYLPEETLFMQYARAHGATVKNGLEMLHLQAEEAWKIWNSGR